MSKCKACKQPYTRTRPMQVVCGHECAISLARARSAKKAKADARRDRAETKTKLEAMEGLPALKRKAQAAFNGFIRARDEGMPCISCGKALIAGAIGGGYDAGHYRSVGSAPHLRFDPTNCHGQCKHCNQYLAGNHVAYRQGLLERIGLEQLELLEDDQCIRRYTREGLKELAVQYRAMTRELEKQRSEA